jgi:HIRAN domain
LGKTQGLVPTDNFEFLAEYNLTPDIHFLTELASLSSLQLPKGTLQIGDTLRFEKEPANSNDPYAVKVFKGDKEVGYIKKIHSKVFYESGADKLKLTVKAIDQNGVIKRAFLKVSL